MSERTDRNVGGQICDSIWTGGSVMHKQIAVQLVHDGDPHAFVVLSLEAAKVFSKELQETIRQVGGVQ